MVRRLPISLCDLLPITLYESRDRRLFANLVDLTIDHSSRFLLERDDDALGRSCADPHGSWAPVD